MRKTVTLMFAAFVVLGMLAACGTNRPIEYKLDDAGLVAEINARLAASPVTSALNVNFDAMDGVVTLTGVVRSNESRLEAERIARTTSGVTRVISRIRVE
jgi:osmotically-inducible protein OsmY